MVKQVVMSNLHCEKCDNLMVIPRKKSKRRVDGHLKHMWCYKCKQVTGHLEHVKARSNLRNETYVKKEIINLKNKGIDFVEEFKMYLGSLGFKEMGFKDMSEEEIVGMLIVSNRKLKIFDNFLNERGF